MQPKQKRHVLEILLEYGVNHIDTAPMYGNAEKRIGSWMKKHRDEFFLATKSKVVHTKEPGRSYAILESAEC